MLRQRGRHPEAAALVAVLDVRRAVYVGGTKAVTARAPPARLDGWLAAPKGALFDDPAAAVLAPLLCGVAVFQIG